MRLDAAQCRRLFAGQRVARLATLGPDGPHIVPIVFDLDGDEIVFAIDEKPKTTRRLQRLENLRTDPRCAVIADHYDDDWSQLWWVRADATASISDGGVDVAQAVERLALRYRQYLTTPPLGPVARLHVSRWTGWAAAQPDDDPRH